MNIEVNKAIFNRTYYDTLYGRLKATNFIYGGSSSGKSFGICQYLVLEALGGRACLAVRESKVQLRSTMFLEIGNSIAAMGVSHLFKVNNTNMTFRCLVSTGEIACVGTDRDCETIKGIRPANGAGGFSLAFVDELSGVSRYAWIQIKLRMRGESRYPTQRIGAFNPISINHWAMQEEILPTGFDPFATERGEWSLSTDDTFILRTNYEDNEHLDDDTVANLLSLGKDSKYYEQVYLRGECGVMGSRVYDDNVHYVDELPREAFSSPWRLGVDHGFNDAQTFVASRYDSRNNTIHIVDSIKEHKAMPEGTSIKIKAMMDKYNIPLSTPIFADSSDPTKNELFRQYGLNVRRAIKGAGSKYTGIMWLKCRRIEVLNSNADMSDSFGTYIWKEKNGVTLDETEHTGSDLLDALRYSYELDSRNSFKMQGSHISL